MIEATPVVVGGAAIIALAISAGLYAAGRYHGMTSSSDDLEVIEGLEGGDGFKMTSYGPGDDPGLLSIWMREKKKKKALGEGLVRWHLVGSSFSKPMYVKPEREHSGNMPEIEYEGSTYYFPEKVTIPAESEGVPVVVHRKGESDPVNLRDNWDLAVDAGTLNEYLTMTVTSKKPDSGLGLGIGDMDSMDLLRYGLLGIIGLFILLEIAGGI